MRIFQTFPEIAFLNVIQALCQNRKLGSENITLNDATDDKYEKHIKT